MPVVSLLRDKFSGSITTDCKSKDKSGKCRLGLKQLPNRKVIIEINRSNDEERCDYLIAIEDGKFVFMLPIEFKASGFKSSKVKKQLEGGIKLVMEYFPGQFVCYPVLVAKRLRGAELDKLKAIRVRFNGRRERIRYVRCGEQLNWIKIHKKQQIQV